ncbi:ABC transporter ATP-binding protein [Nesterenkonia populi]|uniref:ABC transporter ATP-binding protein n=1 Tax=Nesterenkonia populi TaxID=1591087 RepID=UPI0011BDBDD7|nr:ABC transporter ATP-binding protein [Nesterenkonia populi]
MLEAFELTHSYRDRPVLHGVSLRAGKGEVVGLTGPNGSGKTTLLRALYGALAPDAGRVELNGEDVRRIPPKRLAQRVAVVVQEPPSDLMLSVADIVLLGRTPHLGMFSRQGPEDERLAADALERVGLLHLADREFSGLSGGEKQRVLIARALAQQAECLLLDEPTNHLDISYQHQVLHLVRELGITAVVVLHDLNLAARYCDSIVLLSHGRLYAEGSPEEVLTKDTIEPVYHVSIERVAAEDSTTQLLFRRTPKESPL